MINLASQLSRDNIVRVLMKLIEAKSVNPFDDVPSPGFGEGLAAQYYESELRRLGMELRVDHVAEGRMNVFGFLRGSGERESLMLAGHLDTVGAEEGTFSARVKDGRVYGRGACDMKAALAVYIEVARIVVESGLQLKGDLILGGIADEEYKMLGSKYVSEHGPKAGRCIIGEPTELRVCPANKGQICLNIRVFGRAVHSSVPEEGINAVEKMAKVIEALSSYHRSLRGREAHPLCGTASVSAGVIRGGTLVTAVPDFCELEIDRRTLPGETKQLVHEQLTALLNEIAANDTNFMYELSEPTFDVESNEIPADEPVVRALLNRYTDIMEAPADVYGLPFGTDAPNMGCPTVVCGPGCIEQAHSADEYVDIEQLESAARLYLAAVEELLM